MITILLEGDANQFGKVEAALRGSSPFRPMDEKDFFIDFTINPDSTCIILGNPNDHDIVLKAKLDE